MKKAAEQTALSEMKFRAIFENACDAIFLIDKNGVYDDCNPAAVELFGCERSELLNKTPHFFSPRTQPDGRGTEEKAGELLSLALLGKPQRFEWKHRRLDGTEFDAFVVLSRFELHGHIMLQAIVKDISDRKKAEEMMRRNEEQLLLFFEHQLVGMSITSPDKGWLRLNNRLCSMFGYSRRELENLTWADLTYQDDLEANLEQYDRLLKGEIDGYVLEKRFLRKDGTVIYAIISVGCVRRDDGYPDYIMTLYEDITERKLAEDQIIAQAAQIRALIDNLPFDLWAIGADGSYFMQNAASRQIWGDVIGKIPELAAMSDTTAKKWRENNERAFSGEVVKGEVAYTVNGDDRFFYNIVAPIISDQSILGILGVNIDITDRKNLESQLYQSQKMEAIGQLAGGVAHDFNNILTAIIGYAHLLLIKMSDDDPLKGFVGQIRVSAERAAELTNALLTFSRKQIMVPISVDLNDIVGQLEKMLRRVIRESITLRLDLALEKLTVLADKGKIEQVIMNLVTNAADAMPKGGTIVISTCQVNMGGTFIHSHGYGKPGNYACIAVCDTGCGLEEETRKKIFEPFFTTKETGKGTGLGLSIVYGIVKQHNGYINVYSEPGRGTTFRIYIPLAEAKEESSSTEETKTAPIGGTETILLAEDDPIVSEFHRTLLETAGYTVITAVDGEEALDKFLEYEKGIDLLIFDVIMPRMTGKKVYNMIRKATPETRVLFLSGYPADVLGDVGVVQDKESCMSKPVDPEDLLRKVRELLDNPG
jgi:PAS domain S-box-containing protein